MKFGATKLTLIALVSTALGGTALAEPQSQKPALKQFTNKTSSKIKSNAPPQRAKKQFKQNRRASTNKLNKPPVQPGFTKLIRIGWVYSMANAPIIIAKHKGYFAEQGVKVDLKSYKSGPKVKRDLKSGKLDMAYIGVPPVYHWYAKGLKSKIIAKVNYGQASVIVHKNSKIKKVSDFRNKKFAGVKIGSGMDVLLRGFVLKERAGLNPNTDIKISTMKPEAMGSAVEKRQVAGAFSWEPFTSKYLLRGKVRVIMDINKEIPRYPWYVIMAMPEAIKHKRTEILKVLKAHKQAVKFLNSSPTAGSDVIIKAFGLKPVVDSNNRVHSTKEILALAKKRLGWQARLTRRDTRFMQRLMNYSYELGYIKNKLSVDDIIDISFMFDAAID